MNKFKTRLLGWFCLLAVFVCSNLAFAETWDVLTQEERETLNSILAHWETWVPERKTEGTAPMMTFEELYEGLDGEAQTFLNRVRQIDPQSSFEFPTTRLDISDADTEFHRIDGQIVWKDNKPETVGPQYLPVEVYEAYLKLIAAMQKDLGKYVLVESGYRSPAYQLYLFLFYTPKHHYSLAETAEWVALPGFSEHGAPERQAIDFINQLGINGEDVPEEFEALEEYEW